MKGKKASHVGLILSFVVFIGFLFFVLTVLNPAVKEQKNKQTNIELLKEKLIEKLSSNLTSVSVKINSEIQGCVYIPKTEGFQNENAKIKDENDASVSGGSVDGNIKIIISDKSFFKIIYSSEFLEVSEEECELLNSDKYSIGSIRISKYLSLAKINQMLADYDLEYQILKDELGVSSGNNFGVIFTDSDENEFSKGTQEVSGNVYIEEIPVQYYDSDANIKSGSIKIRIW